MENVKIKSLICEKCGGRNIAVDAELSCVYYDAEIGPAQNIDDNTKCTIASDILLGTPDVTIASLTTIICNDCGEEYTIDNALKLIRKD